MLPVWLMVVAGEYLVLRRRFGADATEAHEVSDPPAIPLFPAAVVIVVLRATVTLWAWTRLIW